ncbi:hypothetical protein DITRI_Ditri08aG0094800 [Diplodiscus trichospermus]
MNEWIPGIVLTFKFPRIYTLATNKDGRVADFGVFLDDTWKWTVNLRRNLFDWEQKQWEQFCLLINKFQVPRKKLAVKEKLAKRNVLQTGSASCVFCHAAIENNVVFNGATPEFDKLIDSIKLRLAFWIKAKWPKIAERTIDIFRGLSVMSTPRQDSIGRRRLTWVPPPEGRLKFNVDGSLLGQPGLAGVGGILRDN